MTMKIKEDVISFKRKNHPNESRYPCRPTHELLSAGLKLMSRLDPKALEQFKSNKLVIDEEETAELYDEIKVDDIIGLGILRSSGFISNRYKVKKVTTEDYLICENLKTKEDEEISFQDVSAGFALGFAEILYRDEKPYGVSADVTIPIKIHYEEKEEESTAVEENVDKEASAEKVSAETLG